MKDVSFASTAIFTFQDAMRVFRADLGGASIKVFLSLENVEPTMTS